MLRNGVRNPFLVACLEKLILQLDGYVADSPSPVLVAQHHPRISLVVLPEGTTVWGRTIRTADGRYILEMPMECRNRPAGSRTHGTFDRRARMTIAHELGHVLFWEHAPEILRAWRKKAPSPSPSELEDLCELCAHIFLLPRERVVEECSSRASMHPMRAFKELVTHFDVTTTMLLPWLQWTGAALDCPWLLAMFRYGRNSQGHDGRKWRLVPEQIVLPRGIAKGSDESCDDVTICASAGYGNVGLDTLRLCRPGWERYRRWRDIYDCYKEERVPLGTAGPPPPWTELNAPRGPKGGRRPHRLALHPRKALEAVARGEEPICRLLLDPSGTAAFTGALDNLKWRLFATDLDAYGWVHEGSAQHLLVAAKLGVAERCEETPSSTA